jgi:hypothetical protein
MSECSIVFTFQDVTGDFHIERLRASKADSCFRIESIPLFTPSVSKGDIVSAVEDEDEFHFEMVMDLSGHSTIQVRVFDEMYMEHAFEYLGALGCSWEFSREKKVMAVDIPDDVQYSRVLHYFEKGEEESKWTFKESSLSHY